MYQKAVTMFYILTPGVPALHMSTGCLPLFLVLNNFCTWQCPAGKQIRHLRAITKSRAREEKQFEQEKKEFCCLPENDVFHCISDVSIQGKIGIFDVFTRTSLILSLFLNLWSIGSRRAFSVWVIIKKMAKKSYEVRIHERSTFQDSVWETACSAVATLFPTLKWYQV